MRTTPPVPLSDQMLEQCQAMAKHALASGLEVPASVVATVEHFAKVLGDNEDQNVEEGGEPVDLDALVAAHNRLAKIVAPATPRALALLKREACNHRFGPAPLVRQLMATALIFLVSLIALAMTDYTSITPGTDRPWSVYNSSGVELLARIAYLISAAGVGACFAALFRVNRFIVNNTYDPKYAASYWIRVLMGVISGILLCELIPLGDDPTVQGLTKPTLALLGGFSGNTVYRILERLIQSIEAVVRGDPQEVAAAELKAAESKAGQTAAENQLALAAKLAALRQQLDSPKGAAEAKKNLDKLLAELSGEDVELPEESAAGPSA